jgi:hypothetical protein
MALMILQAAVDTTLASVRGSNVVGVLVSVTDAGGVPYTSLQLQNFSVQVMWHWAQGLPTSTLAPDFVEDQKTSFTGEHIKGIYSFAIFLSNNVWTPGQYTLILQVHEDQNHGQILVPFVVP